jgi:hypothetical protein
LREEDPDHEALATMWMVFKHHIFCNESVATLCYPAAANRFAVFFG